MNLEVLKKTDTSRSAKKFVNYVYDLCSENDVEPGSIDVISVFGESFKDDEVQATNKKFFKFVRADKRAKQEFISEAQEKKLKEAEKSFKPPNQKEFIDREQSLLRDLDSYQNSIASTIQSLIKTRATLEGLRNQKPDLVNQVKEILRSGFWEIHEGSNDWQKSALIQFIPKNDIILSEPHDDGRDFKTNFGKIIFQINQDGRIFALPIQAQKKALMFFEHPSYTSSRFFFPFIKPEGSICWGSAATAVNNLIALNKFSDVFLILERLLSVYDGSGGPYKQLKDFFIYGFDRKGKRPWHDQMLTEDKIKYGLEVETSFDDEGYWVDKETEERIYICKHSSCGYRQQRHISHRTCPSCGRGFK